MFQNIHTAIKIYSGILVFGEFIQILTVHNPRKRIEIFIVGAAPSGAFIPTLGFLQALLVPTDLITGNIVKYHIFYKALFGVQAVNGDLLIQPLFVMISNGNGNFYEFAVVLCKI